MDKLVSVPIIHSSCLDIVYLGVAAASGLEAGASAASRGQGGECLLCSSPSTTMPFTPSIQFLLTGAVSELEPDMRPPKHVDRDGKLDLLRPAGAVVVVQHQGVVLIRTWFARAGGHVTLKDRRGRAKNKERTGSGDRK